MPGWGGVETDPDYDWSWTQDRDGWVPPAVDPATFNVARVHDFLLGGKDNFAADRDAAGKILRMVPDARERARAGRRFLGRAVRALAEEGIDQFIDLGTGIPTSPNVHQMAREIVADARVVYVDLDPVVVTHSRALLASSPGALAVRHDLRRPAAVISDPRVRGFIDFTRPVGLLLTAVLHFVPQEIAPEMLARYRRELPPGSCVVLDVSCRDGLPLADVSRLESLYARSSAPLVLRTAAQADQLFDGLDLFPPGITDLNLWRAEGPPCSVRGLAGAGRIR
jgi:O-methyltransferase involved in polyketide biosynthesis